MILLDTSFLIAYYSSRDRNHSTAKELMPSIVEGTYGEIFITDYIFDEMMTAFANLKGMDEAIKVGITLLSSIELINVKPVEFTKAWELFKSQKTTRLSFTDCTNITVMRSNAIQKTATFDGDFRKFGDLSVLS